MEPSLGLYISIPFCRAKCTYCNFTSGVFPVSEQDGYIARVCEEIHQARPRALAGGWHLPEQIGSIYLGGGTPSTLQPEMLGRLFATVRQCFSVRPEAEITVECAPGQIAPEFLQAMLEVSATRASLGVQSMIDAEAAATGRTHTRAIVEEDVRQLHHAGLAVVLDGVLVPVDRADQHAFPVDQPGVQVGGGREGSGDPQVGWINPAR